MTRRQPHVSRGPWRPPEQAADEGALRLVVGAIAIGLFAVAAVIVLVLW